MSMNNGEKIRGYLNSLPGTVQADSSSECLRMAWAGSGVDCSVNDFEDVLRMYGFQVEELGNKFILRLPSRPMTAANNADRLRNIVR